MRNKEEIEQIIKTKESGYSYDEISKMFGVNKSSIAFYCNEKRNNDILERLRQKEEQDAEYEDIICNIVKKI